MIQSKIISKPYLKPAFSCFKTHLKIKVSKLALLVEF